MYPREQGSSTFFDSFPEILELFGRYLDFNLPVCQLDTNYDDLPQYKSYCVINLLRNCVEALYKLLDNYSIRKEP